MPLATRFMFTILGGVLSVICGAIWLSTFEPHGGVELSGILFPFWRLACGVIYPGTDIPAVAWYGGILLHWPVAGGRWLRGRDEGGAQGASRP